MYTAIYSSPVDFIPLSSVIISLPAISPLFFFFFKSAAVGGLEKKHLLISSFIDSISPIFVKKKKKKIGAGGMRLREILKQLHNGRRKGHNKEGRLCRAHERVEAPDALPRARRRHLLVGVRVVQVLLPRAEQQGPDPVSELSLKG